MSGVPGTAHRYEGGVQTLAFPMDAAVRVTITSAGVQIDIEAGRRRLSFRLPDAVARRHAAQLGAALNIRPGVAE